MEEKEGSTSILIKGSNIEFQEQMYSEAKLKEIFEQNKNQKEDAQ